MELEMALAFCHPTGMCRPSPTQYPGQHGRSSHSWQAAACTSTLAPFHMPGCGIPREIRQAKVTSLPWGKDVGRDLLTQLLCQPRARVIKTHLWGCPSCMELLY